jgi:hypothetical protein
MFMMIKAGLIMFGILAIGDIVSIKTKAKIPMMFVSLGLYLVLIWSGMPKDLPIISNIGMFGVVMIAPLIVHMATLIPVQEFKKQWRAIVVSFCGMIVAATLIIGIGSFIFGYARMVSGVGALCGSLVAAIVTVDKLTEVGLASLAVIPMAIVAIQEPIGQITAANVLRKYAVKLKAKIDSGEVNISTKSELDATASGETVYGTEDNPSPRFKAWVPMNYETPFVIIFKLFLIGTLAVLLGDKTGIHFAVWSLLLGIAAIYLGFLRSKMLNRANAMGITIGALLVYVFTQMNEVTPQVFGEQIFAILFIIVVGIIGLSLGAVIGGKIVGWDSTLSIPVALNALFGFPGNYLITNEVCRSVAANEEEENYLSEHLLAPMLIGGYTTVTIGSILIAGILIKTI